MRWARAVSSSERPPIESWRRSTRRRCWSSQDLHWTDELSLEVIGELARHAAERPLLLVGDYRADEFPANGIHREWRARILGQRHAEEARLRPLTIEETGMATTLILGGELPAPRDVVEAVHERTNGIPLHVEELLAALDDDARADGRRIREAHVPDTIGDAVLARVDRLSAEARAVVRAGAVIGRCFSPDVLAGVVDRPLVELEPTLQELEDAAIITPFSYVDQATTTSATSCSGMRSTARSRPRSFDASMPRRPSSS